MTFIDPNFHFGITNDDHPPTSIKGGQAILQQIVTALQANSAAWNKTLFLFTYDEHGSIYDHVPPFAAEYIDEPAPNSREHVVTRYGVRVPGIVVSPWVEAKCTHQVFDHCSILKTIIARFCPDDPPVLSDRVAFASDFGALLTRTSPAPSSAPMQTMPAPAQTPVSPLPRASTLFQTNADWHHFMARLAGLVRLETAMPVSASSPPLDPSNPLNPATQGPQTITVPDLSELSALMAANALKAVGLVIKLGGVNKAGSWVASQSPVAGTEVSLGSTVSVVLSTLAPR